VTHSRFTKNWVFLLATAMDLTNGKLLTYLREIEEKAENVLSDKQVPNIRALSAASAAKFNITPVRWQHPSHVAIVPTESKGKTEGNNWDTACGNLQT
jgi:hypothetical protein